MNEWTIMFYFAGDNELAPLLVSQLKAITDAGFQENTDVLVLFDPNELGVPTRIYDVNRKRKGDSSRTIIGDGNDPFVRSLDGDDIEEAAIVSQDTTNAGEALKNFLDFCRNRHASKRYMLFLIGHGMAVGNDAFLPDRNPVSAITLKSLGDYLEGFKGEIEKKSGSLELLGLHSCSMSAIEVAYQLKGTAKYMIASEGPQFVGSWPYRQLLKKIFNNLEEAKEKAKEKARGKAASDPSLDILTLVKKLYFLTFHNAKDFQLAGYSHEQALCSLNPDDFKKVTASIKKLVTELIAGLKASTGPKDSPDTKRGKRIKELVLLAHLEAQSYWGESYTDLIDFCRCLRERCDEEDDLKELGEACKSVMDELDKIIILSKHLGSDVQYSRGLSVYFPWSKPIDGVVKRKKVPVPKGRERFPDEEDGILKRYEEYAFTKDFKARPKTWLSFLETYFDVTQRQSREEEDGKDGKAVESGGEAFANADIVANPSGPLSRLDDIIKAPRLDDIIKTNRVGAGCACPSIKNYPPEPKRKNLKKVRRRHK